MADADALAPSPQAAWRNIVALLSRSRLALAVAAVYLVLAIMWLLFASMGALFVGLVACGDDCAVVAAARKAIQASSISLVLVAVVAGGSSVTAALKTRGGTGEQRAPVPKDIARAERQFLCVVVLGLIGFIPFFLLAFVGQMLNELQPESPITGSHGAQTGSVMIYVGVLGGVGLFCLIILPILAILVWKVWRHHAFEAKPRGEESAVKMGKEQEL
ncbi:hypothetical protein EJB05_49065 [Eragrostis curvula]|uniref:Uncharacterized protein n=1 Tax=Eragrostis curvula TaxID=38414 RepID=A0A5J9T5W2_9POAL|nr:hypothetical protein EJB05_49065 [Eragrostis curvula]